MGITLDRIDSAFHSIQIVDAGGDALEIAADGSLTVSATDLDIRDLSSTTDSVAAVQSGTWTIDSITNAVTVTATDLDIRALAAGTDSVSIGDGTDTLAVNTDGSINVVAQIDLLDTGWQTKTVTANNTASQLDATPLANRELVVLQNLGAQDVYVGPANTVTVANGMLVPAGSSAEFKMTDTLALWGITNAGTADVRVIEFN